MRRLLAVSAALLLTAAAPAAAKGPLVEPDQSPDPRGITVSGTGLAYARGDADRARAAAFARAVAQARERAQAVANATGLTLGDVRAVTERDREAEQGFIERCRRCPQALFTAVTVTATFATQQTDDAAPAGRAVTATGQAETRVRPRDDRRSASILEGLGRAWVAAVPGAVAAARRDGERAAAAAGLPIGPLFAIAEQHRPFFSPEAGSFGPGRFCGVIRRNIYRRDASTGRRRLVRRVRQRRCFFPRAITVPLRATWVAG